MRARPAWLLLACTVASAQTPDRFPGGALRIDDLGGDGWQARGIELSWNGAVQGARGIELEVDELELQGLGPLRGLRLDCTSLEQDGDALRCAESNVALTDPSGKILRGKLGFGYRPASGTLMLEVRWLELCAGSARGNVRFEPAGWHAELLLDSLAVGCVADLQEGGLTGDVSVTSGSVSGELELRRRGAATRLDLDLAVADLAFGDSAGELAGEALDGRVDVTLQSRTAGWTGRVDLHATRGVLFSDPVLLDAERAPLALRAELVHDAAGALEVSGLELDQGDALQLAGSFRLGTAQQGLAAADLTFASRALDGLYAAWLQPLLIGTALDDLALDGHVNGRLRGMPGAWSVDAELDDVALRDRRGRFALGGLSGRLAWGDADTPASELQWAGGQLLGLAVGASRAQFTLRDGTLQLRGPLRQPLVDGALRIASLEARGAAAGNLEVTLEAELEPLSLEALGYAFGWPLMAGQVGGAVPTLRYADRALEVDGELRVDLFDGTVRIRQPRLERPLGPLAALHADVLVEDLDLELLTRTFTIGRIEGRFGGRIDGLLLHDWRPVRFDAEFATPPGDDSRHRISQRAIDSITSIGGLGGVLSQGVLRFFEEFGYSRLGFSCRLRGAVCELDGVEPAAAGYYLVKGGGLPRIDIIGHVRRVDWAELVSRVQRAMAAPAPVVR